jgi:hypothetical protein
VRLTPNDLHVDDGESLYHASELHDASCLELLFAAGVPDADRDYCIRRCLDFSNPNAALCRLSEIWRKPASPRLRAVQKSEHADHRDAGTPLGTAIYCAANFRNEHGQYAAVVQLLIDAGEKVTNDRLEFAVANDLDEIASVLKAHGASL